MMDFYTTDSWQDVLDIDIKSEMATDLGSSDFTDTFGVSFSDLPPLLDVEMDNDSTWMTGPNSNSHSSSNFVHNLDLYGGSEANAVMVNPNSVMPSMFAESPRKKNDDQDSNVLNSSLNCDSTSRSSTPGPLEEKSESGHSLDGLDYLNAIKVETVDEDEDGVDSSDETDSLTNSKLFFINKQIPNNIKEEVIDEIEEVKVNLTANIVSNLRMKAAQSELVKINGKNCSILSTNQNLTNAQIIKAASNGAQTIVSGNIHILHPNSKTLLSSTNKNSTTILVENTSLNNNNNSNVNNNSNNSMNNNSNKQTSKPTLVSTSFTDSGTTKYVSSNNKVSYPADFPKPAYSYSCLIAMALKNSRTGSLPVAEIYNFMCQHFPYFKTAPNGWKNSVRHNLSLNKCFEKIEKPATNGNQRKGCLWAMNPSKVVKMDEEVQKWSRKDPQAIRKAMVRPDNLEALERGEMKFCGESNSGEDYGSEDEEELDVDETYLVSSSPACSPNTAQDDETSDVEVMENTYDGDVKESKPLMLEVSLASSQIHSESPAKRPKTNFIYHTVNTTPHVSRRKAPLINRIA